MNIYLQFTEFRFTPKTSEWLDPCNWNQTIESEVYAGCSATNPIPHSNRVPCSFDDDIIFPPKSTIKLKINTVEPVKLISLHLNNHEYNTVTFKQLINSEVGENIFENIEITKLNDILIDKKNNCTDKSGCACPNQKPIIMAKICSLIVGRCPIIECSDPIKPTGFCCKICGSMFVLNYKKDFNFILFYNLILTYQLDNEKYIGTNAYIYKTIKDNIEIVVLNSQEDKSRAHEFSTYLYNFLEESKFIKKI